MTTTIADLAADGDRAERVVTVLADAFSDLIAADEQAFRTKFRKMAASPFAFYRGTACLFYADAVDLEDPWADERTSRIWIQGDLHAANFGTYVDAEGILLFDVNDFDDAYLGHASWDLLRLAASLGVLGIEKALSDETIADLQRELARAYSAQVHEFATGERDKEFRLTLDNTDGAVFDALARARHRSRLEMLNGTTEIVGNDRRFTDRPGVRRLDDAERDEVLAAYQRYLETIPERRRQESVSYDVKDAVGRSGFGIGSAGLPAYSILVEGRTQALENDVVLSMKQGNVAAASRVVSDDSAEEYFDHHGHRTAVSQFALQARADPWLGWCTLRDVGQVVQEVSPYEEDLDWDGVDEPEEMVPLVRFLGQAVAKIHCVSDATSEESLVEFETEHAIDDVLHGRTDEFADWLADTGSAYATLARDDHRRFVDAFRGGAVPGLPAS
ncbi:MAG: DUF2252 domain-containing protein [Actinomycetota bacterium]|nr:DUF2252 domain-containing protein [Actinomycetota bacterium]